MALHGRPASLRSMSGMPANRAIRQALPTRQQAALSNAVSPPLLSAVRQAHAHCPCTHAASHAVLLPPGLAPLSFVSPPPQAMPRRPSNGAVRFGSRIAAVTHQDYSAGAPSIICRYVHPARSWHASCCCRDQIIHLLLRSKSNYCLSASSICWMSTMYHNWPHIGTQIHLLLERVNHLLDVHDVPVGLGRDVGPHHHAAVPVPAPRGWGGSKASASTVSESTYAWRCACASKQQ